eukprot:CAMPEP_0119313552 /NCGR_PEP_ID=MMETSP1333-20130426/29462_1 /TAXON_ID=418940 /ORGANISM="Scyphosphaera apsteinii, Strain RCC1455" /LENGTH=304 /DNA_ID=CAMNT_0007318409 /DNA_START=171 /DNA_END=1085 /DNA_ORIENTATION=+
MLEDVLRSHGKGTKGVRLFDAFGIPYIVRSRSILPLEVTTSQHVKAALPFVGNLAYIALAGGFLMTDILALRVLLVCGYSGLVTFHLLHAKPLRIPLGWSAFFVAVNTYAAICLALARFPAGMTEEDEAVHAAFFERLSPAQFKMLLDVGERRELADGTMLTVERVTCSMLYFVEQGSASLTLGGEEVAKIGRGGFVNDVAFQQGPESSSYGTCRCCGKVRVIAWQQEALRDLLSHDGCLADSFKHILVGSLVEQLLQRYKAEEKKERAMRPKLLRNGTESGDKFRCSLEEARSREQSLPALRS